MAKWTWHTALVGIGLLGLWTGELAAQKNPDNPSKDERRAQRDTGKRNKAMPALPADLATLDRLSLVWGRPTDRSIVASVLAREPLECWIEYGRSPGALEGRSQPVALQPEQAQEIELQGLQPDQQYHYRLQVRKPGGMVETALVQTFHTQRKPGSSYVFELQGDSHPERAHQFDPALYAQTLRMAASDQPDFYIMMGDDFSVDTLPEVNAQTVWQRYRLQRPYLSLIGQRAPVFMVNGNHEQAAAANLNGTADNVAVWAQTSRNSLYAMPAPDHFYSGNEIPVEHVGLLRNYYGWTWGDALFLVIDPYWHSNVTVDNSFGDGNRRGKEAGDKSGGNDDEGQRGKAKRNLWDITIGDAQYQWLKQTLESSKAKYKFVFAHHVLGTGRGGVERAGSFEWGGNSSDGNAKGKGKDKGGSGGGGGSFQQNRPNWPMPIHQLMVQNGVTIFFQGHDHVFARQERDGVVYQTLPQPADPNYALNYAPAFLSGDVFPSTGRVRVRVAADTVRVEYVRSVLPKDESDIQKNNDVVFAYELPAKQR